MNITFDPNSIDSYRQFLRVKSLPSFRITGREAWFPDEYASAVGLRRISEREVQLSPNDAAYDFQRDIVRMAVAKKRFAIFADCGLGKTLMLLDFARYAMAATGKRGLIVSPLNVVTQTIAEAERFSGDSFRNPARIPQQVTAAGLSAWLRNGKGLAITNYEAIREGALERNDLGCLILDESSMLKSHYGKFGQRLIGAGRAIPYKLCCTGTPAPNDRIEYANHAVFLDRFPNVNAFLARYFINRGQTQERWELKPHALQPFYASLADWSIFLANPATYGWRDVDTSVLPPIQVHLHHIDLTAEQTRAVTDKTGTLFVIDPGGIVGRASLSTIAKGWHKGKRIDSRKPAFIRELVRQWPDESTIIWCIYNKEQEILEDLFPDAASITGTTPYEDRVTLIGDFKAGRRKVLISKPKILGFGLNLQIATRQVFSGLQDSYESYYQAVKRSNRIGSTKPLHVHIPLTEIEEPMVRNVLRKAAMVERDTREQERIFCDVVAQWKTLAHTPRRLHPAHAGDAAAVR